MKPSAPASRLPRRRASAGLAFLVVAVAASSACGGNVVVDGAAGASSTPTGGGGGGASPDLPNLVASRIRRDKNYYYVRYCNQGAGGGDAKFTVSITNENSGAAFESNPLYAFSVPPPGACRETGGMTCGLIGDPGCDAHITVRADVDDTNAVAESNEDDNELTMSF